MSFFDVKYFSFFLSFYKLFSIYLVVMPELLLYDRNRLQIYTRYEPLTCLK